MQDIITLLKRLLKQEMGRYKTDERIFIDYLGVEDTEYSRE